MISASRSFLVAMTAAATLSAVSASRLFAQAALDRTLEPTPMAPKPLHVPTWTHTTLANGAELVVTPKRDLPLVSFTINFVGGASQFEPASKAGLSALTTAMMREGTISRTGDQLSDALELLGVGIGVNVGSESGAISFGSTKAKLAPTLDVLMDMLLHPSFPNDALERLRGQTIVNLTQSKDQPPVIAGNVFARVLYGTDHPYGRVQTEESVRSITRDDVVAFHKAYFQPGRAIVTVTGDVDAAAVKTVIEKAFAAWPQGGEKPTFAYPAVPPKAATTIYLVDKPKAAQSVFAIGLVGPPRDNPDYFALQVMNTILGGIFQSRLQHNIREEKGYSYGVNSRFAYGKGPGAFRGGGSMTTAKTDSALIEFMKELRGVQGEKPFTDDELAQGKAALAQSLPSDFASVNATSNAVAALYLQSLPQDYYQTFAAKVNAVTKDDLVRVAKKYIDLDHLDIIIVGDRAVIEEPLRQTRIAPIVRLDIDGKPLPVAVTP
ncbi:MAG TPA: pitrilysin family protein [Gemmatimonadaceae bacterium]|nr:pitrilysin family protein [Gemmatimonadaceae bacterium]